MILPNFLPLHAVYLFSSRAEKLQQLRVWGVRQKSLCVLCLCLFLSEQSVFQPWRRITDHFWWFLTMFKLWVSCPWVNSKNLKSPLGEMIQVPAETPELISDVILSCLWIFCGKNPQKTKCLISSLGARWLALFTEAAVCQRFHRVYSEALCCLSLWFLLKASLLFPSLLGSCLFLEGRALLMWSWMISDHRCAGFSCIPEHIESKWGLHCDAVWPRTEFKASV